MYNKCPIIVTHNEIGHHLAIESWCISHIYTYCDSKLIHSSKVNCGTSTLKSLTPQLKDDLSKILILLNPGYTTAWNKRRQLLVDGILEPYDELKLSRLILKHKPKSPESITYRQMIIERFLMVKLSSNELRMTLENELTVALEVASSYRSNYYAWTYRLWLFEKMISLMNSLEQMQLVEKEVEHIRSWIERNVSDSSGYHYLRQLRLMQITRDASVINSIVEHEIQFVEKMLQLYPSQQSLILHGKLCSRMTKIFSPETTKRLSPALSIDVKQNLTVDF